MNLTDTQSNSSPNVGIIIGAVVGSLAFCSLVVIAAICFLKKKNRSLSPFPSPPPVPSPFPSFEIDPKTITIIELIGSGGFGNVYRARWHETDVAVKELKQDIVTAKKLAEFYREFQAMVELSSPNVVKLYGMTMRKPYQIVMELVENGSLYSLLSNNRNVSWGIRIQIISDIANALLYIHSASVIHRDLKSLNVLLTQDHRAKICDFGLAIMNAKDGEQNSENNAVGSTRWMAPELFCDNPQYTTKSDIFSNGIVIWEVCHLKIPFSELENADVRKAIKAGKTEPISDETPLLLGKLITECLRMDPMERPSATEISNSFPTIHSDIDIVVDTEAVMKQGFFSQKRNASSKKSPRYEEATTASQEHKTF